MNWISYQCDEHIVFQKPSTLFLNFSLYCHTHEHFSLWISLFCSRKCNISNIFSRTTQISELEARTEIILTCSLLAYEYIVLGNRGETRVFRLTYQQHSSSASCTREQFKPSKDLASLQVCNEKNTFGFSFFVHKY